MTTTKAGDERIPVRYRYRLRPGSQAEAALISEWHHTRFIWNHMVTTSRLRYRAGQTFGGAEQQRELTRLRHEFEWLADGSSVAQQQVVRDFTAARSKALSDRQNKVTSARGLPRHKARHRSRPSLNFTRRGFSVRDGRLCLPGGVRVPVVWSRQLPSDPSSVRVSQDALGHWWASFVVEIEPTHHDGSGVIGVDWGIKTPAATTDDRYDLPYLGARKNAQAGLARYQRMMARRKPARGKAASKGYAHAKRQAAKAHERVRNQRADAANQWAARVSRDHKHLAVEDFRPGFMARNRPLAAKAADVAVGDLKRTLVWHGRKRGCAITLVAPAGTTQTCHQCGTTATVSLTLADRTFACSACGLTCDRDTNAAWNMVVRAGLAPARADGVRPRTLLGDGRPERGIPRL